MPIPVLISTLHLSPVRQLMALVLSVSLVMDPAWAVFGPSSDPVPAVTGPFTSSALTPGLVSAVWHSELDAFFIQLRSRVYHSAPQPNKPSAPLPTPVAGTSREFLNQFEQARSRADYLEIVQDIQKLHPDLKGLLQAKDRYVQAPVRHIYNALVAITVLTLWETAQNTTIDPSIVQSLKAKIRTYSQPHYAVDLPDIVSACVSDFYHNSAFLFSLASAVPFLSSESALHFLKMQSMHAISLEAGLRKEKYDVDVIADYLDDHYKRLSLIPDPRSSEAEEIRDAVAMVMVYYAQFPKVQDVIARYADQDTLGWFNHLVEKDQGKPFRVVGMKMTLVGSRIEAATLEKPFSVYLRNPHSDESQAIFLKLAKENLLTPGGKQVFQDDRKGPPFSLSDVTGHIEKAVAAGQNRMQTQLLGAKPERNLEVVYEAIRELLYPHLGLGKNPERAIYSLPMELVSGPLSAPQRLLKDEKVSPLLTSRILWLISRIYPEEMQLRNSTVNIHDDAMDWPEFEAALRVTEGNGPTRLLTQLTRLRLSNDVMIRVLQRVGVPSEAASGMVVEMREQFPLEPPVVMHLYDQIQKWAAFPDTFSKEESQDLLDALETVIPEELAQYYSDHQTQVGDARRELSKKSPLQTDVWYVHERVEILTLIYFGSFPEPDTHFTEPASIRVKAHLLATEIEALFLAGIAGQNGYGLLSPDALRLARPEQMLDFTFESVDHLRRTILPLLTDSGTLRVLSDADVQNAIDFYVKAGLLPREMGIPSFYHLVYARHLAIRFLAEDKEDSLLWRGRPDLYDAFIVSLSIVVARAVSKRPDPTITHSAEIIRRAIDDMNRSLAGSSKEYWEAFLNSAGSVIFTASLEIGGKEYGISTPPFINSTEALQSYIQALLDEDPSAPPSEDESFKLYMDAFRKPVSGKTSTQRLKAFDRYFTEQIAARRTGLTIVDFGIGEDGAPTVFDLSHTLSAAGFSDIDLIGMDRDPERVQQAEGKLQKEGSPPGIRMRFLIGDIASIPSADYIIAANVLYHWPGRAFIFNALFRAFDLLMRSHIASKLKTPDSIFFEVSGPDNSDPQIDVQHINSGNEVIQTAVLQDDEADMNLAVQPAQILLNRQL